MSNTLPTNDRWILVHDNGRPILGRLSSVLYAEVNAAGKTSLRLIAPVEADVTIDETWDELMDQIHPQNVIAVPDAVQPKAPLTPKEAARAKALALGRNVGK